MADPKLRNIKIQTGVVKRIMKEKLMYEKEVNQTEDRIEKMKTDGKDEYDIKKMGEVLAESKMMVPDCLKRLAAANEDLKNKLNDADELSQTDEFKEGEKLFKEAEQVLSTN